MKLPAIEFAMNSARTSMTSFTPFYLNYGCNPSPMIWKGEEVYPGIKQFAKNMKDAIMSAHDVIIASRIQCMIQANKKRRPANFNEGDLIYLSTKNIFLPKGRARKLAPKYLGPFQISKVLKEGATYQLGLSDKLIKQGINNLFYTLLLRPHVPNDDRHFLGRLLIQILGFGEKPEEWIVDSIATHHGKGMGSNFQIVWKAGDSTWAMYWEVAHLNALDWYCQLMGVENVANLPQNYVNEDSENKENNNIVVQINTCTIKGEDIKTQRRMDRASNFSSSSSPLLHHTALSYTMEGFTNKEIQQCNSYELGLCASANRTHHHFQTTKPPQWEEYVNQTYGREQPQAPIQPAYPMYPYTGYPYPTYCQEIGLVALMFFSELLFPYVSLTTSFYVSFTNLFSIILFLIC